MTKNERLANSFGDQSSSQLQFEHRAEHTSTLAEVSGTLVFGPGEVRKIVSVPLLNDSLIESPETFNFVIENPAGGARLLAPRTATITITDDDLVLPDYSNFASAQGMRINGYATTEFNTLQLTNNLANRRGSTFYKTSVPIQGDTSFQSVFQFRTTPVANGGDGLAFVVHYDSRGAGVLGSGAGGLGYAGIRNSLAETVICRLRWPPSI